MEEKKKMFEINLLQKKKKPEGNIDETKEIKEKEKEEKINFKKQGEKDEKNKEN